MNTATLTDDVTSVIDTFKRVYADAVTEHVTEAEYRTRQLTWRSKHRISLEDAATCYATIAWGYNDFKPNMLAKLHAAFPDSGIEVTPAREYSVAVYLHIPGSLRKDVATFVRRRFKADEVDWEDEQTLRVWWD